MADWSTLGSSLGMLPWWPRQNMHSASFCPCPVVWRNISCSTTNWWGVPRPHLGYLSRKSSESTILWLLVGYPFFFCTFSGHPGPLHLPTIMQSQQGRIISNIFSFEHIFLGNFSMCWCHSLTLRITMKTLSFTIEYLLHFLLIVVSFLTYLIISTPDKTPPISQS